MSAEMWLAVACLFGQVSQLPPPRKPGSENIEIRCARAQLQLAEANLNRAEESNKRVARSIPSSIVADYQNDVQVARTRLERVTAGEAASEFQAWLQRAEAERRAAETTWKSAVEVNDRVAGTFDPLDIERFRLRMEVATLQLERGKSLVNADRVTQLRWELDVLDNQVQRLKEASNELTPFNSLYPIWRW
jgi:hypothetical protein